MLDMCAQLEVPHRRRVLVGHINLLLVETPGAYPVMKGITVLKQLQL